MIYVSILRVQNLIFIEISLKKDLYMIQDLDYQEIEDKIVVMLQHLCNSM